MRVGVTLPQFSHDAERALAVARHAEESGIDGVFVFDHVWPLRRPDRPALHAYTLLAALAVETRHVTLGTLVARVSLLSNAVLVHTFATLQRLLGPRLVAGLGTGDAANRDENLAYGLPFAPVEERVADLVACCRGLRECGIRTWVGGRSPSVRRAAVAEADGWNIWGVDAPSFAREVASADGGGRAGPFELSWGGQVLVGRTEEEATAKLARHGDRPGLVHGTVEDLGRHFETLAAAGAAWAVCAPLDIGEDPEAVLTISGAAAAVQG